MKFYSGLVTTSLSILLACFFLLSCSSNSPVSPDLQLTEELTTDATGRISCHEPSLWGLWEIRIDPINATAEIIPIRGPQFTVDVVTFLQPPTGDPHNLGIDVTDISEWLTEGLITVDVRLTHPFPGLDEYTGHDVKGVFIATGSAAVDSDSGIIYTDGIDDPILLNADGYTRWMNPVEFPDDGTIFTYTPGILGNDTDFDPTINAYKYFADDIDTDEDVADYFADPGNVVKRGQFYAGSANVRTYDLQFPIVGDIPQLVFQYAVIAHWDNPVDLDPYDLPGSFPISANAAEAIHLSVSDQSDLWYLDGSSGGSMKFDLEIYNWMPYLDDGEVLDYINAIILDFPGGTVTPSYYEIPSSLFAPAEPGGENSSIVEIEIVGLNLTSAEPITVLVTLVAGDGEGTDLEFDPGNGVNYADSPLAAYFWTVVEVGDASPTVTVTSIEPDEAYQHDFVDDAVITGTNFQNVNSVRLEMGAEVIEADNFTVDSTTQITADFDLAGADFGLYDVVVEVDGGYTGVLEEGFNILLQCGTDAPELDNVYTLATNINTSYVASVLNAGPYDGYTIFSECNIPWGGYRVYDHSTQADDTPIISWSAVQAAGNAFMIEPANQNEYMMIVGSYNSYNWAVIDQNNGALIQDCPSGHFNGIVGDFDGNDDFWGITFERPNGAEPNIYDYYLQHWEYDSGNPSYPYSLADEWNVNDLFRDDIEVDKKWEVFGDLVVLPDADYCFVLTGHQGGDDHKVDKVDISGATPTIVESYSFAGEGLNGDAQITIAQSRCVKMELDTSDEDYMHCRLVIAGSKHAYEPNLVYYMNIYRFDTDLNLLGDSSVFYDITTGIYTRYFYGFGLDTENNLLSHLTNFTWGDPESYYGISPLPADW